MPIADDAHLGQPSELPQGQHGEFIVFVDESGDHSLENVSDEYPIFVLALCVFRKESSIQEVCPALQRFKLNFWGMTRSSSMKEKSASQGRTSASSRTRRREIGFSLP